MNNILRATDRYQTVPQRVSLFPKILPELVFYSRFLMIVIQASAKAKHARFGKDAWCRSSLDVLYALERVGVCFDISGLGHLAQLETPCVVVANHMSVLETVILPFIIQSYRDVTFIVKESLMAYPVFKNVLRTRDPIVVNRVNPRQDLKTVMREGTERLERGMSVVVFPQTTRSRSFDHHKFNSLGIKLANRADVPVVPLALATDAWGNGSFIKDFGKIDATKKVRFSFGQPIPIEGRGVEAHQAVIGFIRRKLSQWQYVITAQPGD